MLMQSGGADALLPVTIQLQSRLCNSTTSTLEVHCSPNLVITNALYQTYESKKSMAILYSQCMTGKDYNIREN